MLKYTAKEVWGFSTVWAAMPPHPTDADHDYVMEFMRAVQTEAESRGLAVNAPSDALDLSRDLILDDAAAKINAVWAIEDDILTLTHTSLVGIVDWTQHLPNQNS